MDFPDIDQFDSDPRQTKSTASEAKTKKAGSSDQKPWNPRKLDNGKWACNHACKDKTA